jgi:hypothetical protein
MTFGHHARRNGNVAGEFGMHVGGKIEARGSIVEIGRPHTHFIGFNLNTTEEQFQQDDDKMVNLNDNHYF